MSTRAKTIIVSAVAAIILGAGSYQLGYSRGHHEGVRSVLDVATPALDKLENVLREKGFLPKTEKRIFTHL